jgi:uncharacterized protein YecT (DUF1311 family)
LHRPFVFLREWIFSLLAGTAIRVYMAKSPRTGAMVWHCSIPRICFVVMLVAMTTRPASSAVDCPNATSRIEKAICESDELTKADKAFSIGYERLIERLDRRQRLELIDSQKRWLTERDIACAGMPPEVVANCVGDALRKRRTELARAFGSPFGSIKLGSPGLSIVVGNETLEIKGARTDGVDILRLVHGNSLLAESQAPFAIDGRGGDETGEAVVVSTHDYGNLGSSEQYLISVRPNEPLRAQALKADNCCGYSVRKVANGLELTISPSAGRDGVVMFWKPHSGSLIFERRLEFAPQPGTTMAGFQADTAPTHNEEFYNALKRAAPRDWRVMAVALEFARNRDDDADGKYFVLSPCSSGRRGCPAEQAFAAYAVGTKLFYFAYELPNSGVGNNSQGPDVVYFPSRENWPPDIAKIVGRWIEGDLRD